MTSENKHAPGILTDIEGIPTATVNNHNEAFYYWRSSGIKTPLCFMSMLILTCWGFLAQIK